MNANAFFTTESVTTLAGAVTVTTVVAGAIQTAFDINPALLAFGVAEAVCIGSAMIGRRTAPAGGPSLPATLFIAFINGCLVFTSASGVTQAAGAAATAGAAVPTPASAAAAAAPPERAFLTPWP